MAFSLIANATHLSALNFFVVILVSIFVFSLFDVSDARNSLEKIKPRTGSKVSYYYNSEGDSMDLPTLDAYDGFSMLVPSPFAPIPTNLISNPPINSPSPSPNEAASPIPDTSGVAPSQYPTNPIGPHPGPSQLTLPPSGAPGHGSGLDYAVWCIARPTVPESMIQRAMDYACGNGADCGSVRPSGPCFLPNSLVAHASYAFNSYWQRTKVAGGTCDLEEPLCLSLKILVIMDANLSMCDPGYNGCKFVYV